jgi:hypothetical protein
MPKGVVAPREVQCRSCGLDFVTDRAGKAGWYCRRPECVKTRKRPPRRQRERKTVMVDELGRPLNAKLPKRGPLEEDLEVVLRLAERHGANPRIFRESIQAVARGEGDQRFHYRRIAAAALCLSAYIGGHTV